MSPKKLILALAATALAVGVLVGSASAGAAMFLHNGKAITTAQAVNYSGGLELANEWGGVACPTADLTIGFDTDDAEVAAFTGTECEIVGFIATIGCEVAAHPEAENLSWTVDPLSNEEARITSFVIVTPVNSGCQFADANGNLVHAGNMTLTAGAAGSANAFSINGTALSPTLGETDVQGSVSTSSPGTIQIIPGSLPPPSAAMFLHEGEGIGSTKVVSYSGPGEFANELGGIRCSTLDVTVGFDTNDANVTAFTGTECETTGLLAAFGCEVVAHPVAENLPWTVDPLNNNEATVTSLKIAYPVNAGCPFADENGNMVIFGNVTAIAEIAGSADAASFSGTLVAPTVGEVEVKGTVTSSSPGTIQISN